MCLLGQAAFFLYLTAISPLLAQSRVSPTATKAPQSPAQAPRPQSPEALHLQDLLDRDNYLAYAVAAREVDAGKLSENQRRYYLGMLAYHLGRLDDAATALISAANGNSDHTLATQQVAMAIETVAEINMKVGHYGDAANDYDIIDKVWTLDEAGRKNIRDSRHLAALLQHVPPQSWDFSTEFTLHPAQSSTQFGAEYTVSVPGQPPSQQALVAQFDTGAELSVLSATTAKAWGVHLLEGTATLHGYSGGVFTAQPGFLPELDIGTARLYNVAIYVAADENLYIPQIQHQTHALLGYPVIAALGRLRFSRDGSVTISPHSSAPGAEATPLWLSAHGLLVELGIKMNVTAGKITGAADPRLFVLDTGSGSTYLTDHYLEANKALFHGKPPSTAKLVGLDGLHEIPAFVADAIPLVAGKAIMVLRGNHILAQPTGGETEHFYGVVGAETLNSFPAWTLDLRTMTLTLTPP